MVPIDETIEKEREKKKNLTLKLNLEPGPGLGGEDPLGQLVVNGQAGVGLRQHKKERSTTAARKHPGLVT
jgi:hypothetical protein